MESESNHKREREDDADSATCTGLPAKTPKTKGKTVPPAKTPGSTLDLGELQERWTPNRVARLDKGIIKIKKPGPSLCGGDWVCNSDGDGATLSFVFWKQGKYYGLTVGHLFKAIGDTVLSFIKPPEDEDVGGDEEKKKSEDQKDLKEEKETKEEGLLDQTKTESLPVYVIGKVVSWSQSTDSVVFQFVDDIEVEPYKIKVAAGLTRDIHLPPLESVVMGLPPPLAAKTLVGFGARRRGFHAKVAIPSMNRAEVGQMEVPDGVPPGCICITNAESRDRITYHGDCGTIFVDLDCNGIYFHHAGTQREPWKSYGYPLWDVMRKHPQLGGTSETPEEYDVRDCGERNVKESHILEPIPAANFSVHVVPGPPRQLDGGSLKWKGKVHVIPNPNSKKKKTDKETGSHHQVFLQQ